MFEHVVLTRLAIAFGDDPAAMLADLPVGVEVTATYEIELLKLRAHAAVRDGDRAAALDHLASAMVIAINTGHRQTFLDDIPTFGALVDNAAAMTGHRLRTARTVAPPQPDLGAGHSLTEPLTERELEVLRLLPTHLTYKRMADELYVSPNTIKSYVKNIYTKLDAHTRTEAVATASTLGFIS